jgi:hypothetical protein
MGEIGVSMDGIWYSTDGTTWAKADTSAATAWRQGDILFEHPFDRIMAYDPVAWHGRFYAVGMPTWEASADTECLSGCQGGGPPWEWDGNYPRVLTSTDGQSWDRALTASNSVTNTSSEIPHLFVAGDALVLGAFSQLEPRAWQSVDGRTWTPIQPMANPSASTDDVYLSVVVQVDGNAIVMTGTAPSGVTSVWTTENGVAVAFDGRIYVTANDGSTWIGTPITGD